MAIKRRRLRSALSLLEASAARNQGVLPLGLDPTSEWEGYAPLKHWKAAVAKWVARKNLQQFTGNRSTTCALLRRACEVEEDQEELEAMPRFPLTKLANTGPDQIRVRFLGGMSALNSTVHHYGHTSKGCPHQSCPGREENVPHFLLECRAYAAPREAFLRKLSTACTCEKQAPCAEFFAGLNAEGKALFMLGGPVFGRSPEAGVDAACRALVLEAYTLRSELLNSQADEPLVRDLTKVGRGGREVSPSLAPLPRPSRTWLDYLRPVPSPQATHNKDRSRAPLAPRAHAHEHARSPRMIGTAKILGSGLNDSKVTGSA